ncbi:MAG TPA: helix-turn-helix transcriptional regulator [Tepidisphaeraceae bacterium]|nr:helix-turn-helix transcriptional regulator [Tepidisphaeraceae bacterium]
MPTFRLRSFVRPPAACHFATPVIEATRPEEPHDHDFVEIFWIESGQGWHWINKDRKALSAGSLTFIRPPDCHAFSTASRTDPLRMVNIAFASRNWTVLRQRYELLNVFDTGRPEPLELKMTAGQLARVQSIATELRMGRLSRLALDRFLLNLIHLVEADADITPPGVPAPPWLGKMLGALANPSTANPPTTTRQLSEQTGCTPEHLARTVRRCLGRTPTEVLNDAKLARAAARLAGTSDEILDIALDSGFGNLSHFYKLFRDRYGTTPRRYRLGQQRIVWPHTS